MEGYKTSFINFLLETNALKFGDFTLKSGRVSPWFVNMGEMNEALSTKTLGEAYAQAVLASEEEFDILYGIPEKGNAIAIATAIALSNQRPGLPWFFTRKFPKDHGEITDSTPEGRIKSLVVGRAPENGQAIAQFDDVFTAGDAKYDARKTLESLGDFKYPVLYIAVDRQEVDKDGNNAIKKYETETGTRVVSIVNATEIYDFLGDQTLVHTPGLERMVPYLREYGTDEAKRDLGI